MEVIKLCHRTKSVLPLILKRTLMMVSLLFFVLNIFLAANISLAGEVTVISNIKEWHHPVKDVLNKKKVILYKVELA